MNKPEYTPKIISELRNDNRRIENKFMELKGIKTRKAMRKFIKKMKRIKG